MGCSKFGKNTIFNKHPVIRTVHVRSLKECVHTTSQKEYVHTPAQHRVRTMTGSATLMIDYTPFHEAREETHQRWKFIKEKKRKKTCFRPRKRPRKKTDNGQEKKERKHALDQESKIQEKTITPKKKKGGHGKRRLELNI